MSLSLQSRRGFLGMPAAFLAPSGRRKRIVFVAGRKSHKFGEHAHNTTSLLMAKLLQEALPHVETVVSRDGWPADPGVFENAASIVLYMDGGDRHPILPHLDELERMMKRGTGLVALHYALVMPEGAARGKMLDWLGGYYEPGWSVNPFWTARFETLPAHPVARGVKPFAIHDEWYYHMRFRDGMQGIAPILTAVPPEWTRQRPFGPHTGNAAVRARRGMPEHVAWAYRRPGGGRGFALTGAHFHWSLAHDDFRNVLLNGIAWTAGVDVPRGGVSPRRPRWDELMANQEGTAPEGFGPEAAQALISPREK